MHAIGGSLEYFAGCNHPTVLVHSVKRGDHAQPYPRLFPDHNTMMTYLYTVQRPLRGVYFELAKNTVSCTYVVASWRYLGPSAAFDANSAIRLAIMHVLAFAASIEQIEGKHSAKVQQIEHRLLYVLLQVHAWDRQQRTAR